MSVTWSTSISGRASIRPWGTDYESKPACFATNWTTPGGDPAWEFTFTTKLSPETVLDTFYFENYDSDDTRTLMNYEVLLNGVLMATALTEDVDAIDDSAGRILGDDLDRISVDLGGGTYSGTQTFTIHIWRRDPSMTVEPILTDMALLGACPIPEPSSGCLLLGAAILPLLRRSRRR